jgi:hypothetical protein
MLTPTTNPGVDQWNSYAAWVVAIFLVTYGFRYARNVITFLLDELYKIFIQQNASGL